MLEQKRRPEPDLREVVPPYYFREEGRLHTAGVVPMAVINGHPHVLIIKEQRADPRFLKSSGSCSFPVGRVDEKRDGLIEEGGARITAVNEAWEEAGIIVDPLKISYLGRFAVPDASDRPSTETTHAFVLTDQGIPKFGQRIWAVEPISPKDAETLKVAPRQRVIYVANSARLDVFVAFVDSRRVPQIPVTVGEGLPDTAHPHFVPLEHLTTNYQTTHGSQAKEVSLREGMILLKFGQATGSEDLYIPWSHSENGVLRPWVAGVIDRLGENLPQIQSRLQLRAE